MFVDDIDFASLPDGWKISALENVAKLSAGGDKPAVYSDYPTGTCNVPIFSNGIDEEGLYGFTNKAKIFEESVRSQSEERSVMCFCEKSRMFQS